MGGNVAENLSNQSVPEAAARVAAVVNRLVNRIGSNAESRERLAEIEIPEELRDNLALFLRLERRVLSEYDPEIADLFDKILTAEIVVNAGTVSYTHLRAHETDSYLVCRLLLEKKKRAVSYTKLPAPQTTQIRTTV